MLRSALLLLALPLSALAVPPALSDLAFLNGAWEAEPDASGARGAFTLEESRGGKVLVRRNTLNTPAREDRPASSHEDLMVVSLDQDALKATSSTTPSPRPPGRPSPPAASPAPA